jgi:hypothetical protein
VELVVFDHLIKALPQVLILLFSIFGFGFLHAMESVVDVVGLGV